MRAPATPEDSQWADGAIVGDHEDAFAHELVRTGTETRHDDRAAGAETAPGNRRAHGDRCGEPFVGNDGLAAQLLLDRVAQVVEAAQLVERQAVARAGCLGAR